MSETRYKCPKCDSEVFWKVKQGVIKQIREGQKLVFEWERLYKRAVCSKCHEPTGIEVSKPSKKEEDD